jgi:DNA-directed RNA polymerase I subunit RPA1
MPCFSQPTLHKPGIMAHRVRILHNPTQKTIRMHYANCNTYNADFDGDEMNVHYPQNDLARAEAQYIARTDLQYIVPTDGTPLRGLIQDHVVGGVKMTKKDTFFEKWEYQQLLFAALASLPGLEIIRSDMEFQLLPPAIIRPRELWTGKQVISTLLLHLRRGSDRDSDKMTNLPGLSMERKSKTPETAFGIDQEEHLVLVRNGELLRGVLDKAAFGATDFSLVHATFEAYGPDKAGILLSSLGRLFTAYIQFYAGHSCRMEDLVLTKAADKERRDLVHRAYDLGARAAKAWADSEGGKVPIPPVSDKDGSVEPLKPVEAASTSAKIGQLLSGNEGKENFAALDGYMQGQLNPLSSEIVKKCLPHGLAVPFPYNTFGVMTTTGAKGSIVNQSQVTCALGQQALEGRRVPRLSSGRTLPSFAPYDPSPRADGFVMDRFLTGIRPQEYYFHCMAGREGLVDTAVKTSRSGYLQRCLIKHLEELKICYDYTVRNSEGSVVQFVYGEDGLDPTKASYLDCTSKSFEYMARNIDSIKRHNPALPHSTIEIAAQNASVCQHIIDGTVGSLKAGDRVLARRLRTGTEWKRGTLCRGWQEAFVTKVHKHGKIVDLKYTKDDKIVEGIPIEIDMGLCGSEETPAASSLAVLVKVAVADPIVSSNSHGHRLGSSGACVSEKIALSAKQAMAKHHLSNVMKSCKVSTEKLSSLIGAKYSSSLCAPGEAVGCIAAQSVGEPSTQMTLNTFHLAGAGANVTLGIPRLREIIMTASRTPKTPTMSVPLLAYVTDEQGLRLTREFSRITLFELISGYKGVSVAEKLEKGDAGEWLRAYYINLTLHPAERIHDAFGLSLNAISKVVTTNFVPLLTKYMHQELRRVGADANVFEGGATKVFKDSEKDTDRKDEASRGERDELNDDDSDDNDDSGTDDEDGADAAKYRRRAGSVSYDNDDMDDDESPEETDDVDNTSQTPDTNTSTTQLASGDKSKLSKNSISLPAMLVDPAAPPLLMVGLVEKAADNILIRSKKKISQAFVNEEQHRGRCLQTAGVNFEEMWELDNVDHDQLLSNDVWAIRGAYGVEAARSTIVTQIKSVFGAYGIEVDPRHLSLIGDYMTFNGDYKAMNRIGMEETSSPMLQMSFETTVHFLKKAAMENQTDTLTSPSSNIVVGRPVHCGTGSFSLLARG